MKLIDCKGIQMHSFEVRNCSNIHKFKNICNRLQNGSENGSLAVRQSIYGCYPVPLQKSSALSRIVSIAIPAPANDTKTSDVTDFKAQVVRFFTLNAKHSLKHKKISLNALSYLGGVYCNVPKIKTEIQSAIQEIKRIKKNTFAIPVHNLITELRTNQETCDFTILCSEGEKAMAHWCILKETPFFKSLSGHWAEKINKEKTYDLTQFPKASVELLLDVLYTRPISTEAPFEQLMWLYCLTEFLDLKEIQSFVKIALQNRFKKDGNSFADALIYSYTSFEYPSPIHYFLDNCEPPKWKLICTKKIENLVKIFIKMADHNNPSAQCYLALFYKFGYGVELDLNKGFLLHIAAAEQGHAMAQFRLAICYMSGEGVEKNPELALDLYTKAAAQGLAYAQSNLAYCYNHGCGVIKDQEKAAQLYTKAADQGNAIAQHSLGTLYELGQGVVKDLHKAFELYTKAADQSFASAQCSLANFYMLGKGIEKDIKKAFELFTKSAHQGDVNAIFNLGILYAQGKGVQEDRKKAIELYGRAAQKGHANALYYLHDYYWKGQVVNRDKRKAIELLKMAAGKGHKGAKKKLVALKKNQAFHSNFQAG